MVIRVSMGWEVARQGIDSFDSRRLAVEDRTVQGQGRGSVEECRERGKD